MVDLERFIKKFRKHWRVQEMFERGEAQEVYDVKDIKLLMPDNKVFIVKLKDYLKFDGPTLCAVYEHDINTTNFANFSRWWLGQRVFDITSIDYRDEKVETINGIIILPNWKYYTFKSYGGNEKINLVLPNPKLRI